MDSVQLRVWWDVPLTCSSRSMVTWKCVAVAWTATSELPWMTPFGRVIVLTCRPRALAVAGSLRSTSAIIV